MRILSWPLGAAVAIALVGAWLVLKPQGAAVSPAVVAAHAEDLLRDANSPVGGNPDGDVTLVEFFDYNCPYCRQMLPAIAQAEAADPLLRVVYKVWPVLGPDSVLAAKAALAAARQDRFLAFHRALYQLRGSLDESKVLTTGASVDLDVGRLKSDMRDTAIDAIVRKNLALAGLLGIDGTPGFVIGTRILVGPTALSALQTAIRDTRAGRHSVN